MKNILVFGDSNTWGYLPPQEDRYPYDVRYPGRLQMLLGEKYHVIEDGLNGRTVALDDSMFGNKNGTEQLKIALECHRPLDLLIVMLGSNDLKKRFSMTACDIAFEMVHLILTVKSFNYIVHRCPEILIVSPPYIGDAWDRSMFSDMFGKEAYDKSRELAGWYQKLLPGFGARVFDAAQVCEAGPIDGLHLDPAGHRKLADALFTEVKNIIG